MTRCVFIDVEDPIRNVVDQDLSAVPEPGATMIFGSPPHGMDHLWHILSVERRGETVGWLRVNVIRKDHLAA